MVGTMAQDQGTEFVTRWIERTKTRSGASDATFRSAIAGAFHAHGQTVATADVDEAVVGSMTPEISATAVRLIVDYVTMADETHRRGRSPSSRCARCDAPATMTASLGPACADHYDDLS